MSAKSGSRESCWSLPLKIISALFLLGIVGTCLRNAGDGNTATRKQPTPTTLRIVKAQGTPTPIPIADIDFLALREKFKDLTDAQKRDLAHPLVGQRIQWTGWIEEVQASGRVSIEMDPPGALFSLYDVSFTIPKEDTLKYAKDQKVTFQGDIESITELLGFTVRLEDAVVIVPPTPVPTMTHTKTATATGTPKDYVSPTPVPTQPPAATPKPQSGTQRNPAHFGEVFRVNIHGDVFEIAMTEAVAGQVALDRIVEANMFNFRPADGTEYVLFFARAKIVSISGDGTAGVDWSDWKMVDSGGAIYKMAMVVNPEPDFEGSGFEGAILEGWVTAQRKIGDQIRLVFGMDYDGTGGVWFAAP